MTDPRTYTLQDVLTLGIEAIHVDEDGVRYLWHGDTGLRVDDEKHIMTLITNPKGLPEGPWVPTDFGELELKFRDAKT